MLLIGHSTPNTVVMVWYSCQLHRLEMLRDPLVVFQVGIVCPKRPLFHLLCYVDYRPEGCDWSSIPLVSQYGVFAFHVVHFIQQFQVRLQVQVHVLMNIPAQVQLIESRHSMHGVLQLDFM